MEGESFHGTGPSKQIAKNICAEHCIQYIVTKRCTENKNKAAEAVKAAATTTEGADKNGAAAAAATEGGADGEPGAPEGLKPHEMTDETPWAQLASLALFKLFNDWQAQGFAIPAELFKPPDYFNNQGTAPPMKVKVRTKFRVVLPRKADNLNISLLYGFAKPGALLEQERSCSWQLHSFSGPSGSCSFRRRGDDGGRSTSQHAMQEGPGQPDLSPSSSAPERAPRHHQLSARRAGNKYRMILT